MSRNWPRCRRPRGSAPSRPGSAAGWGTASEPSAVPTALAVFPRENFIPLRHIAEQTNNIVQWTEFDHGGHFPAMEEPDLLVADIRAFFRKIRGVSPG